MFAKSIVILMLISNIIVINNYKYSIVFYILGGFVYR